MPFSVLEKTNSVNIHGENDEVLREVFIDANCGVVIKTSDYELGRIYKFSFSAVLEEADGDEPQHARYGTIGNCVVGIGMDNPNEWDELDQCFAYCKKMGIKDGLVEPPFYDETDFHLYSMRYSDDRKGFEFKLLDKSREWICFDAIWITADKYSLEDCEYAVSFWIT